jgi:hypothetical protein
VNWTKASSFERVSADQLPERDQARGRDRAIESSQERQGLHTARGAEHDQQRIARQLLPRRNSHDLALDEIQFGFDCSEASFLSWHKDKAAFPGETGRLVVGRSAS